MGNRRRVAENYGGRILQEQTETTEKKLGFRQGNQSQGNIPLTTIPLSDPGTGFVLPLFPSLPSVGVRSGIQASNRAVFIEQEQTEGTEKKISALGFLSFLLFNLGPGLEGWFGTRQKGPRFRLIPHSSG